MAHSLTSAPWYSSVALKRSPTTFLSTHQTANEVVKAHTKSVIIPINWPKNVVPSALSGTTIKPKIPTQPCTEIDPTGSSIVILYKPTIDSTTMTPETKPIQVANKGVGVSGLAVMATKPAKAPLRIIVRSALRNLR